MAPAVDVDTRAVDIARVIGRQEGNDGRNLFRLGQSPERNLGKNRLAVGLGAVFSLNPDAGI